MSARRSVHCVARFTIEVLADLRREYGMNRSSMENPLAGHKLKTNSSAW